MFWEKSSFLAIITVPSELAFRPHMILVHILCPLLFNLCMAAVFDNCFSLHYTNFAVHLSAAVCFFTFATASFVLTFISLEIIKVWCGNSSDHKCINDLFWEEQAMSGTAKQKAAQIFAFFCVLPLFHRYIAGKVLTHSDSHEHQHINIFIIGLDYHKGSHSNIRDISPQLIQIHIIAKACTYFGLINAFNLPYFLTSSLDITCSFTFQSIRMAL